MESAVCVRGFILLIFSTQVHLRSQPRLEFGFEGGDIALIPRFSGVDDTVLYRVHGGGDLLLLINCSQPERPQPYGYEVRCDECCFKMSKLTLSQSGDYRAEGWRGGNITEHRSFRLTVCAEKRETPIKPVFFGDSVEMCGLDSPLGNGSSLQLYRHESRLENPNTTVELENILVLDTKSSLEPLVEDLRGRLQVDLNTSLITLSGVTERDYRDYYCTAWRGAQCQSYNYRRLRVLPRHVFAHEENNVTLPCIAKGQELPDQVHWINERDQLIINQTNPQEVMYMLNGSQTGDYSLIISSVSKQHSGGYGCKGSGLLNVTGLWVCPKLSPLEVMFSPGQSVLLDITEHLNTSMSRDLYGIQWNRQKVLQPQALIVDFHSDYDGIIRMKHLEENFLPQLKIVEVLSHDKTHISLPEDLRGRVTVSTSHFNSSLIISNLTAEDSGVYTWRVYGAEGNTIGNSTSPCYEGSFRLVYLHPYGVHSPLYRAYAPLIGCGLLGLVAAVVWLKLRSRRGEQTSGRQSREGQQSGDEDLYDEVEMAELNTPPSAGSAGAVEHSV